MDQNLRYQINLLRNSKLIIGNSSSGILETPSFKIPTINIGNRQNGRIQSSSIINCNFTVNEISKAIKKSMSKKFKKKIRNAKNPYFKKNTYRYTIFRSELYVKILKFFTYRIW